MICADLMEEALTMKAKQRIDVILRQTWHFSAINKTVIDPFSTEYGMKLLLCLTHKVEFLCHRQSRSCLWNTQQLALPASTV